MSSYTTKYRLANPEYREKEKEKDRKYSNNKYSTDEEYRRKKIERASARYYKLKEENKMNNIKPLF
jgi:hypothetical protein